MKKKKIIRIPDSEPDLTIIGISSHEKGFTLSWALNRDLGWTLSRGPDLVKQSGKEEEIRFPVFRFPDNVHHRNYFLIQNRISEGFLYPAQATTTDFLLVVPESLSEEETNALISRLKSIMGVQTAFVIPPETLPDSSQLIPE